MNRNTAERQGLVLKAVHWETDSYPGFHVDGLQEGLIDPIIKIEDCDILICIFWKRFGTNTKDGKTGTEHEFYKAYEAWKQNNRPNIMLYFNQKEYFPRNAEEAKQQLYVFEFKENLPKEGLSWDYNGLEEFKNLVYDHLTKYLEYKFQENITDNKKEEIKIFISYAREDEKLAIRLYNDLKNSDLLIKPWMDKIDLLPGQNWKSEIKRAIKSSTFFIPLFSSTSVKKRGYVQSEFKYAIEVLQEIPPQDIFVIPVKLDECEIQYEELKIYHIQDFFPDWYEGLIRILKAIQISVNEKARNYHQQEKIFQQSSYPQQSIHNKLNEITERKSDPNPNIRSAATAALSGIEAKEAIPELIAMLKDKDPNVRSAVVSALGRLRAKEAIPELIAMLKDKDSNIRIAAVSVLGQLQVKEAIPELIALLKDEDPGVRSAVAAALG